MIDWNEIVDIVETINHELENFCGQDLDFPIYLKLKFNGICNIIEYLGIIIWNSEEDDREYSDYLKDYEELKSFIKRKINEINKIVNKIKL